MSIGTEEIESSDFSPSSLRLITECDDLTEVTQINLSVDSDHSSVSELGNLLPNLTEFKFTAPSFLPSFRKFGSFMNLKILWASAVGLESLDGASGLPNLQELYVSFNQITDLSSLTFLPLLEILDLESNQIESGLELRFLSLCPGLRHVTMWENPISGLADYRKIVSARLPKQCVLDDGDDTIHEFSMNFEDANFIKELVADGLLDEDELLADEPLSRPFTAIGIRPKSGLLTPFSAGATRPRTAINNFIRNKPISVGTEKSSSILTSGAVMQGHRGLLARGKKNRSRPNSASARSTETEEIDENIKQNIEKQLDNWKAEYDRSVTEVNILKIGDDGTEEEIYEEEQKTHVPERSTFVRSIRTPSSQIPLTSSSSTNRKDALKSQGYGTLEDNNNGDKFIPDQARKKSPNYSTSESLSSSLRDVLKFKDIKKTADQELNSMSFRRVPRQIA